VDRQTAVDDVGGEEPTEVVRSELGERRVGLADLRTGAGEHVEDGAGGHDTPDGAELALQQEWHGLGPGLLMRVIAADQRNGPRPPGLAADDLSDGVKELGGHGNDTLAFALGRGDHQERDDLAVGPLVLADAEVG
jgi:hypothetical protein